MWTFSDLLETCVGGLFFQLDSVTLIRHGLRHRLLFVGHVGCFHGFVVMNDGHFQHFCCLNAFSFASGLFFFKDYVLERATSVSIL